jgi:hypothetical protein
MNAEERIREAHKDLYTAAPFHRILAILNDPDIRSAIAKGELSTGAVGRYYEILGREAFENRNAFATRHYTVAVQAFVAENDIFSAAQAAILRSDAALHTLGPEVALAFLKDATPLLEKTGDRTFQVRFQTTLAETLGQLNDDKELEQYSLVVKIAEDLESQPLQGVLNIYQAEARARHREPANKLDKSIERAQSLIAPTTGNEPFNDFLFACQMAKICAVRPELGDADVHLRRADDLRKAGGFPPGPLVAARKSIDRSHRRD